MDPQINDLLSKFESSWQKLMTQLESFPPALMNKQWAPGKWSVVQIMQHLTFAEGDSVKYMKYKLSTEKKFKKAGFKAWYRWLLLKIALLLPVKFKAPAALPPPKNSLSFSEAKEEWAAARSSMRELIETMSSEQLNAELYKHPIVGRMNMSQALKFMQEHFDRHEKQIMRVMEEVGKR